MSNLQQTSSDRIAAEAAEWFGLMREPEVSKVDQGRFAQWLVESPVHVREYLSVSETWGALKVTPDWPEDSTQSLLATVRTAKATNVASLETGSIEKQPVRVRRWAYSIAASVAVAVGALMAWQLSSRADVYSTGRGEQRSIVLSDGSIVQLNTLTKMTVRFDAGKRRIELTRGEAFFRVSRDARRPFDVATADAVVRVLGTEFNVYNGPKGTRVAVVEGKVQVAPSNSRQPIALSARQSIDIAAGMARESAPAVKPIPSSQAPTAWMQRRIVFDNDRIDDAVEEFNRYNKLQMTVADPALAALRISGAFSADDPEALMKYLRQIQDVTLEREDARVVLKKVSQPR